MARSRVLPVVLAVLLQIMPMLRALIPLQARLLASPAWAFVLRVTAGATALLGSYDAVSGATAIVTPYAVNAAVGVPYNRQLTTSGQTAHSWSATTAALGSATFPLTPGLVLTNSNGKIAGTPTVAMTTNIVISAWENSGNKGASISATFTFTITNTTGPPTNIPPAITTSPQSQTNTAGSSATFTVAATGTAPLSFQWLFNGATIGAATASNYTLVNLQTNNAGYYSVIVTNAAGSITSSVAGLTVVVPAADIAVAGSGPANASPGTGFSYALAVTNLGPSVASNVVVTDVLPATATFVSATGGGVNNSGVVTWPAIASLAAGGTTSFTVSVTAPSGGNLTNVVSAAASTTDPNPANNNGTAANAQAITSVVPLADVAASCSGPGITTPGGAVNYTITVTNLGPSTASNVVAMDVLPATGAFVSASGGGIYNSGVVTWPAITTLGSGIAISFTVAITAPAGGDLTNTVSSTASVSDPNVANNNGSAAASRVITAVGAQADVTVSVLGVAAVEAGSNLTYTVNVTNLGPSTATNVAVSDVVSPNALFVSATGGGTVSNNVVRWPLIASLLSAAGTSFSVTVTAPGGGTITNAASATSATPDPNAANNNGTATNAQVTTIVVPASGIFGITGNATITLNSQSGLYDESVAVTNTGLITAAALRLYVGGLRTGVQLYNAIGTSGGRPYVQYNASLNPGQAITFVLEFYVPDRLPFTDTLEADAVLPFPAPTVSGSSFAISRVFTDLSNPAAPRFVIEFPTTPGATYTVIYSDDNMATWKVATPSFTAGASVTQWYDDGPPKTVSKPLLGGNRFYQVINGPATP